MAREVIERFSDDLDPSSEATHTGVRFSFENTEYSIDLNEENYMGLKAALERFVDAATRVSGSGRGRAASTSPVSAGSAQKKQELQAVRAWAEKNGIELNARGRIAESVLAAYRENDPSLVKAS